MSKSILLISVVGALGACTTTSFAPPNVNTQHRVVTTAVKGCSSVTAERTLSGIDRDIDGAMDLIDNFELAYRCAQNELANGRRYFEVPAFLLGVAGLVGPSLGLGPDGKLVAGAGAGVLGYGNGYFAPKAKATVVGAAHRAVVCIQTESVGLTAFKNKADSTKTREIQAELQKVERGLDFLQSQRAKIEQEQTTHATSEAMIESNLAAQQILVLLYAQLVAQQAEASLLGEVWIDAELQYFQMVSGGLLTVHSILGERLRDSGSADSTAVFNQLKELAKTHAEAEKALDSQQTAINILGARTNASAERELVKLKIAELYPKIQTCVLQARL